MPGRGRGLLVLALLGACEFPRPADVGDDLGLTILVSPGGDDSNDGVARPVKTLKHALGIAASDQQVTKVQLATGRYDAGTGETFPYVVSSKLIIAGPAGGGAVLVGSRLEQGLLLQDGIVQDLEFEDFSVALAAQGTVVLRNIHVRTSEIAIRAETTAKITADNIDIAGALGKCSPGIELNGAAELAVSTLVTRALGTSVHAREQSKLAIVRANITGDNSCDTTRRIPAIVVSTSEYFTLTDSFIDGGDVGISFGSTGRATQASIVNSVIRNASEYLMTADNVVLEMNGGQLVSGPEAIATGTGTYRFVSVIMSHQRGYAIELDGEAEMSLRGCTLKDNGAGIYLYGASSLDLGSADSPGGNLFQNPSASTSGIYVDASAGAAGHIDAVGNTWRPSIQGADVAGRYTTTTVSGPIAGAPGNNFSLPSNWTISL